MSLFGAMSTAVSGLSAQAGAFANIGDNVANSQTIGFKRIDTTFEDYLTVSTPEVNQSGTVTARPNYVNDVQGSITQTDNPLSLAIAGHGFFSVSRQVGDAHGSPVFGSAPEYTRAGDFSLNKDGYLVNGSGHFLNGWLANATGTPDQTKLSPVQVSKTALSPVATTAVSMVGNVAQSADGAPVSTPFQVYDSLGQAHSLQLNWAPLTGTPNSWTVAVAQPGSAIALGTATVAFGPTSAAGAPEGTVGSITGTGGTVTGSSYVTGSVATLGFKADLGAGMQTVEIGLGTFGKADGLTQYPGATGSLQVLKQNGASSGTFSGVATKSNGDVVVSYDNGQSRTIARVPLATFADPNALQREDGQAFSATRDSGTPAMGFSGTNGSSLVGNATEGSNVDIAKEFTKLIVAQRAYSANTKLVTTADELMQQTIDMKR